MGHALAQPLPVRQQARRKTHGEIDAVDAQLREARLARAARLGSRATRPERPTLGRRHIQLFALVGRSLLEATQDETRRFGEADRIKQRRVEARRSFGGLQRTVVRGDGHEDGARGAFGGSASVSTPRVLRGGFEIGETGGEIQPVETPGAGGDMIARIGGGIAEHGVADQGVLDPAGVARLARRAKLPPRQEPPSL
ncbi:MAG: hypothetical protein HZY79_10065 [Rhodoblastus sp.]|nr:MAG: hypothetical protein HZY79_10065 [Rhodoblastus sp.]